MMRLYLFPQSFLLLLFCFAVGSAQTAGSLDFTFGGGDGIVAYSNPLVVAGASDLEIQSDGKFVALTGPKGGLDSSYSIIRYNLDGSPDSSFGNGGTVSRQWGLNFRNSFYFGYVRAIAIQNIAGTERILMAGQGPRLSGNKVTTELRLDRFLPDGSLDTSFGTNGTAYVTGGTDLKDIDLQTDQKILAVSWNTSELIRLTVSGSLDSTFGNGGKVSSAGAYRVAVGPGDSIIVSGFLDIRHGNTLANTVTVRKYTPTGGLNTAFGTNGVGVVSSTFLRIIPSSLVMDYVGNIIVGGRGYPPSGGQDDLIAVRLTPSGLQDTSFSGDGLVAAGFNPLIGVGGAVVQSDGKVILVGSLGDSQTTGIDAAAARYNYDGSFDSSFGTGGTSIFNISGDDYVGIGKGGVIQIDPFCACEKVLVAGGNDHLTTFARLNLN